MTDTIHDREHLDVLIIGAGLSGIGAGHYVKTACPWASFAIFESRGSIGGTWDLFTYPGLRSDSDMFTLGYSFRPWTGRKTIADGPSILQYIEDTAREEGLDEKIRFRHRIVAAAWSTDDARWTVTAERTDTGETIELTAGFLFSCTGYYRYDHGYQPDFPGMEDFAGTVVHPQQWPEDLDYAGKRVVVIGSGATAVTLVPSLARTAGHVTMLQRSPTYITSMPESTPLPRILRTVLPKRYGADAVRWMNALGTQAFYQLSQRRPALVKKMLRKGVERRLPEGYDIDTHFTPTYDPWDQRLCLVPDGDLFAAISDGSVDVVTDHIETFTETGVRLVSGAELEADIIVTATGLDLLFMGGIDATIDGEPRRPAEPAGVQGDDAQRRAEPGVRRRLHERLVDAQGRAHLRARHAPAAPHAGHRDAAVHAGQPRRVRVARAAARPVVGLRAPLGRSLSQAGLEGAVAGVHQSYLADYRSLKRSEVTDPAMAFTNPVRSTDHAAV